MAEGASRTRREQPSEWTHPSMDPHDVRRVAVQAVCDPRAVVRYLYGGRQSNMVCARVEHALRACGLDGFVADADERQRRSEEAQRAKVSRPSSGSLYAAPHPALARQRA